MSTEERPAELERSFVTLTHLAESASERADTHQEWINLLGKAQAETETKIAALVDAQVRTEDVIGRLGGVVAQLGGTVAQLSEAVAQLNESVVQLNEAVVQLAEAQARTDAQVVQLTTRVDKLADMFERYLSDRRNVQG
jgi:chromosome segregation ATPase